jgi:hypothetical protein
MKKWAWLTLAGVALFFALQPLVFAVDPPHSLDSLVDCGECHGDVLFIEDPSGYTPQERKEAIDLMCSRCHKYVSGIYHVDSAPLAKGHTSAVVQGRIADFYTSCTDCHHPHFQSDQFMYGRLSHSSEFFLATGTAASVVQDISDPDHPRTTITYNTLNIKPNSEWDTSGPPENDPDVGIDKLAEKTSTGRGAIFLRSKNSHNYSHIIESIDAATKTIVVKGAFTSVSSRYGFAIAYGQAIIRDITFSGASGVPVVFVDKTGKNAFADNDGLNAGKDSTPNGVCQVCHTQTNHWQQTPDIGRDDHYSGENCMVCHLHRDGFKQNFANHTNAPISLSKAPIQCTGCHDPANSLDIVSDIHVGDCNNCHTSSIPVLRSDYETPIGPNKNCGECHANYSAGFETGHKNETHTELVGTSGPTPTTNCVGCHSGSIVTVEHQRASDCINCHTSTGADGRLKDGDNDYGDASGHLLGTTSSCYDCHNADGYFGTHTHTPHDVQHRDGTDQSNSNDCEFCHNDAGADLSTWNDIFVEHLSDCTTCHDATRDTNPSAPTGITVQERIQTGSGDKVSPTGCLHCHGDKTVAHMPDHVASGFVTGSGTSCVTCHDPAGIDDDDHYLNTVHSTCGTCHVNPAGGGALVDRSAGSGGGVLASQDKNYESTNPGGGSCTDCHDAYGSTFGAAHMVKDHRNTADTADMLANTASCTTNCHDGTSLTTIIQTVHTNDCTNCHTNSTTDGRLRIGANLNGDASGHVIDSASNCASCHGGTNGTSDYNGDFEIHDVGDHTGIAGEATCTTTCHDGSSAANIISNTHDDTCTNCHSNTGGDGRLIAGGNGNGTAENGSGNCVSCHSDYDTSFLVGHDTGVSNDHTTTLGADALVGYSTCTTACHLGTTAANIVNGPHNVSCVNCHTHMQDDGTLRSATNGDASGHLLDSTSSCADCHSDYKADFEAEHDVQDHDGLTGTTTSPVNTPPTSDCTTSCHTGGSTGTLIVSSAAIHNNDCTNCHTNTGSNGELVGVATNGSTAGHVFWLGNTSSCADCHSARAGDFQTTNHTDASPGTTVELAAGDLSAGTACSNCHNDNAGSLASWADIYVEHLSDCGTCHDSTRHVS